MSIHESSYIHLVLNFFFIAAYTTNKQELDLPVLRSISSHTCDDDPTSHITAFVIFPCRLVGNQSNPIINEFCVYMTEPINNLRFEMNNKSLLFEYPFGFIMSQLIKEHRSSSSSNKKKLFVSRHGITNIIYAYIKK